MDKVRFVVAVDYADKSVDEADEILAPVLEALGSIDVEVVRVIEGIFSIVCKLGKDKFESLFNCKLIRVTGFVPDKDGPSRLILNWELDGRMQVPESWKAFGVKRVVLDRYSRPAD